MCAEVGLSGELDDAEWTIAVGLAVEGVVLNVEELVGEAGPEAGEGVSVLRPDVGCGGLVGHGEGGDL